MKGRYKAKFEINDMILKDDIITVTSVRSGLIDMTLSNGTNVSMDKKTFIKSFVPYIG